MNHPDLLWLIRSRCEQVRVEGGEALSEPLVTAHGDTPDSPEARVILNGAVNAAKLLLTALEEKYEFSNGQAELKEEACLD